MAVNPFIEYELGLGDFIEAGRESLIEILSRFITSSRPNAAEIHGLPGMGKTRLMRFLADQAFVEKHKGQFQPPFDEKPWRLVMVYVTFQDWPRADSQLAFKLHQEFFSNLERHLQRVSEEPIIRDALKGIIDSKGPTPNSVDGILAEIERVVFSLVDIGLRPVLLLDDFSEIVDELEPHQINRLAQLRDFAPLLVTTERRLEKVQRESHGSKLFKKLAQLPIGPLDLGQSAAFMKQPISEKNVEFPDDEIRLIISWTGGFPELLLLGGSVLWDTRRDWSVLDHQEKSLTEPVSQLLGSKLRVIFERHFDSYFALLDLGLQEVLLKIANEEIIAELRDAEPFSVLRNRLAMLERYGLVRFTGTSEEMQTPELFSPLFKQYLSQRESSPLPKGDASSVVALTSLEERVYEYLRGRAGELVTFSELGRDVWALDVDRINPPTDQQKRAMHIAISKLRGKLEKRASKEQIVSLRSQGYRFELAA